ncbi:aromatic ring-hydroxylating dioxygenase subunit alpha [Sphingopyxis sp. GW247-27LB]|uniref:aromatic ring-hydroxylating dioxygenase subunit alpha n=1 Tax=Sphingopyxis sp. GW247-27LB TaxID=2012632 RepID=UPI000BA5EAA7|nr:aromatic ring-hydroxylating dioxygenase subunit alpha [Sphingopyxis sp. GW247-27LB]PAL23130.1 Rieske (2Fe-2S) protein [Sphingopyxis sp. GW247-27LB]
MSTIRTLEHSTPSSIDYRVYDDPEIFALEQERIFRGPVWSFLGLSSEVPEENCYKSTFVGETPVVLVGGKDGALHAWVNRCVHKGAKVCRNARGRAEGGAFVCVYHQWAYDTTGALRSVPYRRGMVGKGGMPASFDIKAHRMMPLRVDKVGDMIFATFSDEAPDLRSFLGPAMCRAIERIFVRPTKVIGRVAQRIEANWKLYAENSRDSYHGGLLHLFYTTFGLWRPAQDSKAEIDEVYGFHNSFQIRKPQQAEDPQKHKEETARPLDAMTLLDPTLLELRQDIGDDISLSIQSIFPSVVLQQIGQALAVRHMIVREPGAMDLVWTYFGFQDDEEEMTRHRLRAINMVGPAGYVSVEDGEAVEICTDGIKGPDGHSLILMDIEKAENPTVPMGLDENAVRGFWKGYLKLMRAGEGQ